MCTELFFTVGKYPGVCKFLSFWLGKLGGMGFRLLLAWVSAARIP